MTEDSVGSFWKLHAGEPDCDCKMFGPAHQTTCALVTWLKEDPKRGAVLLAPDPDTEGLVIWDEVIDEAQQERVRTRYFETGATRDTDQGKLDYEAFLSRIVLRRYAEYMHEHRKQSDGELRDGDNWQKGMPRDQYMKSAWRHFHDWWTYHRSEEEDQYLVETALCALLFNVMGYLHEYLQED